jgi:phospholipase/carboxylesterase
MRLTMPFALVAALVAAACATEVANRPGRLTARPHKNAALIIARGELPLGLGDDKRDGRIYVPAQPRAKYPVLLLLHGATGSGAHIERKFQQLADEFGFIIVAPDSRGPTWDVRTGAFESDAPFINRVLENVFARYPVDASRLGIAGFSDGASYALTIGIINGDLFTHIIAFSPGFIATRYGYGHPPIFIAHGTRDEILDFENTDKVLVPGLRRNGYQVRFRRFDGPHTVPPDVAREAVQWWLAS